MRIFMLNQNRSKAFTLVEVLVAMLILAIGLLGLAGMTVVVLRSNDLAQRITEATNLTRSMMETMKRESPRFSGVCEDEVSYTPGGCAILESSGIEQLDAREGDWLPVTDCAMTGVLTGNRTFDVTDANMATLTQSVNNFCDYSTQIQRGQYVRYFRVIDAGGTSNERLLRAVVLYVDRFGKWRQIHLETTVLTN